MREIGRQRRLRRLGLSGLAAMVAIAVGGSVAATQAQAASTTPAAPALSVSKAFFGSAFDKYAGHNLPVFRYTLRNDRGMSVQIITYGAIVQDIWVPGSNGHAADVVLGFKTLADYVKFDSPPVAPTTGVYFGETVGRYANRIAKGTFSLNQPGQGNVTYTLPVNNGPNALHGGIVGFGNHVWASQAVKGNGSVGVQLTLNSPNGDEGYPAGSPGCPSGCTGYPAAIKVVLTYTLNNANQLVLHYTTTNESKTLNTIVNLTNHSYFNLAGESSFPGSAYHQLILINANRYTPTDTTSIPLGFNASVFGTPFDFTRFFQMGARIQDVSAPDHSPGFNQLLEAQGYDHNWVLNKQTPRTTGPLGLNLAARAIDPSSGRLLTVWTDQPGVQFYTSNFLTGTLVGISGHAYRQGQAYTFETQHFPNSP
ncbi:MAG TPA: aldose epimerase family protein, partial [Streptosporangiaceae bacterium]|nr:aldose epimerase family protein [Streptosporangiaceae bacterium]